MSRWPPRALTPLGLGTTTLAMLTGWLAVRSWRPLVEQPEHFIFPTLACGLLIVLVGTLARSVRMPWFLVPPIQALVCALFVNRHYASGESLLGFLPTRASLNQLADTVHAGAVAINTYASPVSAERPETYLYLVVGAVGILIAIDLLACGLGKVPLAALPVLLTLSIPISVLDTPLSGVDFVFTAFAFLLLLSTEETRRVLGWGRAVAGRGGRWDSLGQVVNGGSVRAAAARIGVVTTISALLIPLLIPVAGDLFGLRNGGNGSGPGSGEGVKIVNPLVDLRRDLRRQDHTPLVHVETKERDPSYLRTTVLDDFNGIAWQPSQRNVPSSNRASGQLPTAPGLLLNTPGTDYSWKIRIDKKFDTRWLPLPYPTSEVKVSGDWRYDLRTLDLVNADSSRTSKGLKYSAVAFEPKIDVGALDKAPPAPNSITEPMTELPQNLPAVIEDTARQVSAGAKTDFQRMVKIQDWFRSAGGFTYSTVPAPGSGMRQLARFITTDKVGYCEQFAAAMAVMGRSLGIPSRVAVGFLRPKHLDGDNYLFTSDNLHAWPEVYFTGVGWVRFEPTPGGHTGTSPNYTREQIPTAVTPTKSASAAPKSQKTVAPNESKTTGQAGSNGGGVPASLPVLVLALLLVLLVAASPRLLRDSRRRARLADGQDPPELAAGAWAELVATATDLRFELPVNRSLRTSARALAHLVRPNPELGADLDAFVEFVERARYARPFEIDVESRALVLRTVHDWSAAMAGALPARRARMARLFPRSVWTSHQMSVDDVDRDASQVGERV